MAADDEAFRDALAGRASSHWGDAASLGEEGLILAVPARDGTGRVVGAIRISYPSAPLDQRQSPRALAVLKQQVWGDLHRAYPAALEDSMALVEESFGWPDLKEGVASYVERRPPAFPPLGGLDAVARSVLG